MGKARLSFDHPLFLLCDKFTDNLLELGKEKFLTGLTDFHSGGDHVAALRDPQQLALDLVDNLDSVKLELARSQQEYYKAYDHFYEKIIFGGSFACSWMGSLFGIGKFYIPSNDFSCMISNKMFEDVFLEGIAAECRFFDQSIYHLDGPAALKHLDSILSIKELDAVQWVCGAGNEGFHKWTDVYQKIQKSGKSLTLSIDLQELPLVFDCLRPEGVYFLSIEGVNTRETTDVVLKRIEKWK